MRSGSPAVLTGRILDERGNPMSPTYASNGGVRYRYYTSHALLQGRAAEAGKVSRVSAPDLEKAVIDALRANVGGVGDEVTDREIVQLHVQRMVIERNHIALTLSQHARSEDATRTINIAFAPYMRPRKGIAVRTENLIRLRLGANRVR
jgi:site-specific DNA recombinase